MEIFIEKNGATRGPYTLDEIRARLAAGTVLPDDWTWHPDLEEWIHIRSLLEDEEPVGVSGVAESTAPQPQSTAEEARPVAPVSAAPMKTETDEPLKAQPPSDAGVNRDAVRFAPGGVVAALALFALAFFFLFPTPSERFDARFLSTEREGASAAAGYSEATSELYLLGSGSRRSVDAARDHSKEVQASVDRHAAGLDAAQTKRLAFCGLFCVLGCLALVISKR